MLNESQQAALATLTKYLGGAAALGIGGRAAYGLSDMLSRNADPNQPDEPEEPQIINVPYKVKKPKPQLPLKTAAAGVVGDFMGANATGNDPWNVPAMYPAAVFGVPAAAYAGYAGLNEVLRQHRMRKLKGQIGDTQKELEEAERAQFAPRTAIKSASDKVSELLDATSGPLEELAANFSKQAWNWSDPFTAALDTAAYYTPTPVKGTLGMGALGIAGAGGLLAYQAGRQQDPEVAKAKALKRHLAERRLSRPIPLAVRFQPVEDDDTEAPAKHASADATVQLLLRRLKTGQL